MLSSGQLQLTDSQPAWHWTLAMKQHWSVSAQLSSCMKHLPESRPMPWMEKIAYAAALPLRLLHGPACL